MNRLTAMVIVLLALAAPVAAQETPEALQQSFMSAVRAADVAALGKLYAEDAVLYPVGEKVARGRAGVEAAWQPFLRDNTIHDVKVTQEGQHSGGDIHVAWGLWSVTFTPKQGGSEKITLEGRFMDMAKKIDGKWLYVVDHASLPFEPPE